MKLIYNNFDGLDLSFQGALPEKYLRQLSEAREQAQNEKREVLLELGDEKIQVMVAETGARGGYRYRFDTGLDGETWFIVHSTNVERYNIRVSVKSLALALSGYEAVKERLLKRLESFKAKGPNRFDSANQEYINTPLERISRLDYCFDIIMPSDFEPDPKRFVAHMRANKVVYGEEGFVSNYAALNGDIINTVRIGEMPGRQAVIYNKTKEITASSKRFWWQIWELDPEKFDKDNYTIWRIEVRAGRDELDKWNLKRFEDFETKAGDVIAAILKAIRYTKPYQNDDNRSRWPMDPIWEKAYKTSYKALEAYSSNAIRDNVIRAYKEDVIKGYRERLIGNAIGYNAAIGRDVSELPVVFEEMQKIIKAIAQDDKNELIKKHIRAGERLVFLD